MDKYINTRGTAQVRVTESCLVWKIPNFNSINDSVGIGRSSSVFKSFDDKNKLKWLLEVYPNGLNNDSKDYVSVRLANCTDMEDIFLYVELSLLDKEGEEMVVQDRYFILKKFQTERSFPKFVKKSFLCCESDDLLPDGTLTIKCKIYHDWGIVEQFNSLPAIREEKASKLRLLEFDEFEQLLNNGIYSDAKLMVDNIEFNVHKSILSARSRVFSAMFEHNMKERNEGIVKIGDIDEHVLREVLRFIYAGKVEHIDTMAMDLLAAADKYELDGLKNICENKLIDDLTTDNVTPTLVLADRYKAEKLFENAITFFKNNVKEVVQSEDFKKIINQSPSTWLLAMINVLIDNL